MLGHVHKEIGDSQWENIIDSRCLINQQSLYSYHWWRKLFKCGK